MLRHLLLFLILPVATLAQEATLELQASGLHFPENMDLPVSVVIPEYPEERTNGNLTVTCILAGPEVNFTLRPEEQENPGMLVVETSMQIFRYRLLDQEGKALLGAAIYSRRKCIDMNIHPPGTYFLQVNHLATHRISKR